MTVIELILYVIRWCTPNFIKRRQIRPYLKELNRRISVRNEAFSKGWQQPHIIDDMHKQNGPSLDRTMDFILDELSYWGTTETWSELIIENKLKEERRIANEKAEDEARKLLIVTKNIND